MKTMKKQIRQMALLATAALAAATFTACENDNSQGSEQDGWNITRFIDMKVTKCVRVGQTLQVEFNLTNKLSEDLEITAYSPDVTDSNGKEYAGGYYNKLRLKKSYNIYSATTTIGSKETIHASFRVTEFGRTNVVETINYAMKFGVKGYTLAKATLTANNIGVDDPRPKENGVQTCDTALVFSVTSCKRTEEGNANLMFNVKNTSKYEISLRLSGGSYCECYDDEGTRYTVYVYTRENVYGYMHTITIPGGGSVDGGFFIKNVSSTAKNITLISTAYCATTDYSIADDEVRFLSIKLEN